MISIKNFLLPLMIATMMVSVGCDREGGTASNLPVDKTGTINSNSTNNQKDPKLPPNPPQNKSSTDNKIQKNDTKEIKIKVYYPDESGMHLVGVNRQVKVSETNDKYKAAVEAVMTPPNEKNLVATVRNNSSLLSVKVQNGTAFVDFDKKIKNGFSGGSTGEEFLIGSVVNTLTEFNEIKKVKFLINGKEIETLSGHMDLTQPIERMNDLILN